MPLDGDLGLGGVVRWFIGVAVVAIVVSVLIAVACSKVGRRRFGCGSVLLALALTVCSSVVAVVLWRTKELDATRYDWLWACFLAAVGWLVARRLCSRSSTEASDRANRTP